MATSSAGRHIELVTGRVVLHALDDHGQPFCGHDKGQLTQTGQPWNDGYLPHLPRCHSCTAQVTGAPVPARPGTDDGPPRRAAQASDVDIRTAHGADRENAGSCCPSFGMSVLASLAVSVWRHEIAPPACAGGAVGSCCRRDAHSVVTSVTAARADDSSAMDLPAVNAASRAAMARLLTARG